MNSSRTVTLVAGGLLALGVIALVGALYLDAQGRDSERAWATVGAAAVGLPALLARTGTQEDPAQAVVVQLAEAKGAAERQAEIVEAGAAKPVSVVIEQPADEPVPVEATEGPAAVRPLRGRPG